MGAFVRGRASQVLLCGALIATAVSTRGHAIVHAQVQGLRWDGLIELISGKYDYPPPTITPPTAADGPSQMSRHAVSGDGRYIVFNATAPSLGYYGDALYLRDRRTTETRLLLAGPTRDAVISANGRHIAFTVCEPYMRPDYAPICDVWSIDTWTWTWSPLSVEPHQGEFGNGNSDEPVLSSDGRFVVFRTAATNLVQGVPAGVPQLVIRDRDADRNGIFDEPGPSTLEIVSARDGSATAAGNGPSETAEVSDDGRYVAFRSAANDLVPGDTNGGWDVFRRDRLRRDTRRLNVRPYPAGYDESPVSIDSPAISMTPDGRFVAFASDDPLLAPSSIDDYNNVRDVFVFDAEAPYLERLDIGWGPPIAEGYVPGNGPTEWPTLSMDGRYVSLQSKATNVETQPTPGSFHIYVVDRVDGRVRRVSMRPDGAQPDRECVRPSISLDGTVVTFVSQAFNLARNVFTEHERIYAAVHLEITPAEQFVSGGVGGTASYEITTQQHTNWWLDWQDWQPWIQFDSGPMGIGSGTLTLRATQANPTATARSATIRIFDRSVVFTQLEGLSMTSVSPAVGPAAGGTEVTITGTGFEPNMRVMFGGAEAVTTQYVDSTTLIATTPAHAPETVYVGVFSGPPDDRAAWLDAAFRYTDSTPPQLWYGFSDVPSESGWFNRDVTLFWSWWDEESDALSTSGCETAVIGVDTPGTTYTCTVTTEGGTSSLSASVKRDATPPTATITSPQFTVHNLGQVVEPAFTCSDALSGVATCVGSTNGAPIDTSTPGYHTFSVAITDHAGNPAYVSVDYAVGSGVCAYPLPNMVSWLRMEGNTWNWRTGVAANATRVGLTSDVYVDAIVGQGYQFEGANGYLQSNYSPRIFSDKKFALAAWVKPSANTRGTIMRARDLFGLARLETGTIGWAWRKWNDSTLSYRDTRVPLPLGRWSHVVVVLDGWAVRTYLNGRLAHTEPAVGDVLDPGSSNPLTIGGTDTGNYFKGVLDEVQIFQHALTAGEIEQLFLAGSAGACVPKRTSFEIVEPIPASFGSPTYAFDVRLVDEDGQPVSGRPVQLLSQVGAQPYSTSTADRVTDADGRAHWDAPLKNAPRGLYESFASATFTGDIDYVRTSSGPDVLVGKGTPVITWPAPAPITYSFPVNSTQLNATANVPGTFSYSPSSGTLLPAGEQTLSVTFTPADTADYNTVTATAPLTVTKATPNVVIEAAGTWVYTGAPRAAVGKVKDRFDAVIATPELTYNGSPDAPVMPGEYTVVATFPGNANYEAGSATATLTITKATVDIQINAQDVTYDGMPHPAGVTVSGLHPDFFAPDSVTYNGSTDNPVNAGAYTVVATFDGTAVYEAATATRTFLIHKAMPTVTVTGGSFTYDGAPHAASGTVSGGGGAPLGTPAFTYNGAADVPVNAGVYNVIGTYAGDANHTPATGSGTLTIDKAVATVTVTGGTFVYDAQPHPATGSVTGVGGVPLAGLTFTYNGSAEPPVNAGGYVVTGTYPGDANYQAATRDTAIQIGPATPIVTVIGGTFTYDGQPHGASATVTGIGGVDLGPAMLTYDGSADVPVNAGTYVAVATFDGVGNYGHATGSAVVTILKATAVLGWSRPAAIVYGRQLGADQLNATASVFGAFDYSPAAGTVLEAGASQTLTATFTPADPANYVGGTVTTTIDVSKALAEVTAIGGTFTYNGQPHPATGFVTGASGAPLGTPTFTYNGGGDPPVNVGTYEVVATYAGSANYEPASATTAITVLAATPLLNWAVPQPIVYGTPLGGAQLNATANVPGTFTYSPAAGTVLPAGASQVLTATFTSADPNYSSDSIVNTVIDVSKAAPALNWHQPAAIVYGTALGAAQLNATSSVPGTFTYSPAAGTVLAAGTGHTLTATFTPADTANYAGASVGTSIAVGPAALLIRVNDSVKRFGAPLPVFTAAATGFVNGDTFASLSGALSFATGATAQSAVGAYPVSASGVSSPNYVITFLTGTLTVVRGSVTVSVATSPAPSGLNQRMTFTADVGAALPAATAPDGTVRFFDGATLLGSSTLSNGSASLTTAGLTAGTHTIEARYDGDASFEPGSAAASHTVNSAAATPSITITSTRNPSSVGQSVTLRATLGMSAGPISGTVEFYDGAALLGTSLIVSGSATVTTTAFAAGSHAITVRYLGSASAPPAISGVFVQAVGSGGWKNRASSMALSASPNPSPLGANVTLTANVTGSNGTPTGAVLFMVNGEVVGGPVPLTAVSGSTARATFVLPGPAGGCHIVTATYLGSSNYKGSTGTVTQTVN